ncbi:acyl carrier protein [Spirillospora sp. CA-294931]|uniref:acyl carrier protein n=1 Tax=Spirillospora sp. CA-294931 TaxID=3240042 RepID=UPI003D8DC3EF
MTRQGEILAEVVGMIVDVVGEDFLLDVEVGPETTFNDDLALESIEFVALAERLRAHYGDGVDIAGFIAGMDLDQIMTMTVGDLVAHIEARPVPAGAR